MDRDIAPLAVPPWPTAARLLGLGRNSTYDAIARGEIPSIKIGSRILVPIEGLKRMLAGGQRAE
ncbi:MAG: helix-turn-helix domain-containing protein [Stellaceae bacterium]